MLVGSKKEGFILVEIVASVVLVASLVVIAYMIFDKVTSSNKKVSLYYQAINSGRSELESLLISKFADLTSNNTWSFFSDSSGGRLSNDIQYRVLVNDIYDWDGINDIDAKTVTIEVKTL